MWPPDHHDNERDTHGSETDAQEYRGGQEPADLTDVATRSEVVRDGADRDVDGEDNEGARDEDLVTTAARRGVTDVFVGRPTDGDRCDIGSSDRGPTLEGPLSAAAERNEDLIYGDDVIDFEEESE